MLGPRSLQPGSSRCLFMLMEEDSFSSPSTFCQTERETEMGSLYSKFTLSGDGAAAVMSHTMFFEFAWLSEDLAPPWLYSLSPFSCFVHHSFCKDCFPFSSQNFFFVLGIEFHLKVYSLVNSHISFLLPSSFPLLLSKSPVSYSHWEADWKKLDKAKIKGTRV